MENIIGERLTCKVINGKPYLYTWCYDPSGACKKNKKARQFRSEGMCAKDAYAAPSSKFKWLYLGPVNFYYQLSHSPKVLLQEIQKRFMQEEKRINEKYNPQNLKLWMMIEKDILLDLIHKELLSDLGQKLQEGKKAGLSDAHKKRLMKDYHQRYKEIKHNDKLIKLYEEKFASHFSKETIERNLEKRKQDELFELEKTYMIIKAIFKDERNFSHIFYVIDEYVSVYHRRREIEQYFEENKDEIKEQIAMQQIHLQESVPYEKQIEKEYKQLLKRELDTIKLGFSGSNVNRKKED